MKLVFKVTPPSTGSAVVSVSPNPLLSQQVASIAPTAPVVPVGSMVPVAPMTGGDHTTHGHGGTTSFFSASSVHSHPTSSFSYSHVHGHSSQVLSSHVVSQSAYGFYGSASNQQSPESMVRNVLNGVSILPAKLTINRVLVSEEDPSLVEVDLNCPPWVTTEFLIRQINQALRGNMNVTLDSISDGHEQEHNHGRMPPY